MFLEIKHNIGILLLIPIQISIGVENFQKLQSSKLVPTSKKIQFFKNDVVFNLAAVSLEF